MIIEKWDGHTHTQFCRHGNEARIERYVERAIAYDFTRYSITEHPPLPSRWIDNVKLMDELAMDMADMPAYLDSAWEAKKKFEGQIDVTVGLELDYLDGHTDFTDALIDKWGNRLEDVLISVHYLKGNGGMRCIDFTPDDFQEGILSYYGTMEKVVDAYYEQVEMAITYAAKLPYRRRIGHINLIEKFRQALPVIEPEHIRGHLTRLLPLVAEAGVGIDVNTAGLRVSTNGQSYVPAWFINECRRLSIPCVYGSDSHKPDHVGFGWDWYEQAMRSAGGV